MQSLKQRKQLKMTEQERQQENQRLLAEYYDTLIAPIKHFPNVKLHRKLRFERRAHGRYKNYN